MIRTPAPATRHARDVRVTWWYTVASVVSFVAVSLLVWFAGAFAPARGSDPVRLVVFAVGAVLLLASTIVLLARYRVAPQGSEAATRRDPRTAIGLALAAAAAVTIGVSSESVLLGAATLATAVCLVPWPQGVRLRISLLIIFVLIALWIAEDALAPVTLLFVTKVFAVFAGPSLVVSLWWWDVVRALDHARRNEGRLAATQERLRLASDLHDLQGHHLQVIALQLELAERTLASDPEAAAAHLRAAHDSVEAARTGTRELASRFRGVPLPDELANAADLLRAAGLEVALDVAPEASRAPVSVLGPIVREATTNVLKHGDGGWVTVSLRLGEGEWMLRLENDAPPGPAADRDGAGLASIAERARAAGGESSTEERDGAFVLTVTIPEEGTTP